MIKAESSQNKRRLPRRFYQRDAAELARALLGMYLVRHMNGKRRSGMVVETEAYLGARDKAAHTYNNKKTERTKAMFYEAGFVYTYFIYGMHWMFNVSANRKDNPEAVLIRAIEPEHGDCTQTNGPAKLCRWLDIIGALYGEDLTTSDCIWLEDRGVEIYDEAIVETGRVGVQYAEEWAETPLRYYISNNPCVSR